MDGFVSVLRSPHIAISAVCTNLPMAKAAAAAAIGQKITPGFRKKPVIRNNDFVLWKFPTQLSAYACVYVSACCVYVVMSVCLCVSVCVHAYWMSESVRCCQFNQEKILKLMRQHTHTHTQKWYNVANEKRENKIIIMKKRNNSTKWISWHAMRHLHLTFYIGILI